MAILFSPSQPVPDGQLFGIQLQEHWLAINGASSRTKYQVPRFEPCQCGLSLRSATSGHWGQRVPKASAEAQTTKRTIWLTAVTEFLAPSATTT
ncbi:hypothetical protein DHEL01_v210527 [Diaporthe helianthi]|uniref:Uncharacterized protein n=1 Tax=Diaporthe helianthi TaxID=158607 RepID=A0A2P5HLG9_DIAHE|nr:hypothetical protein DHEL01_v210527 [Diaporthe helianthi]